MPAERLSMRKIKEVLRLKFGLGLGHRQIARSCSINHSTVADYVRRAEWRGSDGRCPKDWMNRDWRRSCSHRG